MGSEQQTWTPGLQVGSYRLERRLGKGGMGEVWLATHLPTNSPRALKTLFGFAEAGDHERFLREALALAALDGHPHVVRVHEVAHAGDRIFMAMDLAQPGDLHQRLEAGPLEGREARALFLALASGLAHVHAHGFLHRDLKPSNVLFADDGRPMLADFGLVRGPSRSSLTTSGEVLGTPSYMAPEQVMGAEVDERTDVYGLGALLYHVLTGRPPFAGPTPISVLQQVVEASPLPPSRVADGVFPGLEHVCLRALAKDPADRFRSAREFTAALRQDSARRSWPRWLPLLPVILLLAALGVALASLGPGDDAPQPASQTDPDPAPLASTPQPPPPPEPELEPEPHPQPAAPAAPSWETAEKAWRFGEARLTANDPTAAVPAFEFAFAHELDLSTRLRVGEGLVKALSRLPLRGDLTFAEQALERIREVTRVLYELPEEHSVNLEFQVIKLERDLTKHIRVQESRLLTAKGDHEGALRVAEEITKVAPESPMVALRLAKCLTDCERDAELAERVGEFFLRYPHEIASFDLLVLFYDALGRLGRFAEQDRVLEDITECSDEPRYYAMLLRARERGPYAAAEQRFASLSSTAREELSADERVERARLAYLLGQFALAERLCRAELEAAPTSGALLLTLAELLLVRRQPERARTVAERVPSSSPHRPAAELIRAEALHHGGQWASAIEAADRALSLDPKLAERTRVLVILAHAHGMLGHAKQKSALVDQLSASENPHLKKAAEKLRAQN